MEKKVPAALFIREGLLSWALGFSTGWLVQERIWIYVEVLDCKVEGIEGLDEAFGFDGLQSKIRIEASFCLV